jgi:tetratricopeptide (TPR) repeat protein
LHAWLLWLNIDSNFAVSHVVALANSAAALYCLNRQGEAEDYWLKALKLCPSYLEAAEHLVGLLYRKRSSEAIEVINFVQQCLILPPSHDGLSSTASNAQLYHHHRAQTSHALPQLGQSRAVLNVRISQDLAKVRLGDEGDSYQHGYGSSGYALPGSENGRMLALVHAKGTLLYSQKQIGQASKAFEEAVLISVGRHTDSITHLVHRIQTELAPREKLTMPTCQSAQHLPQPLLLPPEKARQTAQLVFSGHGELPGLRFVTHGPSKRAAIQTTSNSLLSLAKIFQDAMSNGANGSNPQKPSTGVSDILALYYLSLSLQESPSTANNVGILLAGVQQPVSHQGSVQIGSFASSAMPGMIPGSGLALALAYYQYGLRLDPRHVHLHTNLGSLLKDIGQLDLAIQMYEQAVSCDGTFDIALTNLANAVKDRGRINDAITYYRRAVESNPDFAEAVCGLFTALNSVCDWKGRGGVVLGSGKFDRWHVDDDGALLDSRRSPCTSGLAKRVVCIVRKQLEEASQWGRDTLQENIIDLLVGDMSDLCSVTVDSLRQWLRAWKGKPWEGSRLLRLAERALRVRLRRWYHDRYVSGVKSVPHYRRPKLPSSLAMPSAPTVLPFHTFTCPLEPSTIRSISQRNAARISFSTLKSSWVSSTLYPPPPPPEPQLNVGYLSSDFNNHPLAHL